MKRITCALVIGLVALALLGSGESAYAKQGDAGAFLDNFNDGVIGEQWNSLATDSSEIYEANGVLNMQVANGPRDSAGSNQVVDTDTKEHVLKGDFDVRVQFQLDPEFHAAWTSAYLSVEVVRDEFGKETDSARIAITKYGYRSTEEHEGPSGGNWTEYASSPSDDLKGTLRINRHGNLITTYYWDHGWVRHAQWQGIRVSPADDFKIRLGAWNGAPAYSPFWVTWDNLRSHFLRHPGK